MSEVKSEILVTQNRMRHSDISKCIHRPNLGIPTSNDIGDTMYIYVYNITLHAL